MEKGAASQSGANDPKKVSFGENFLLSGSAAAISKSAVAPVERVKLLLQNQTEIMRQGRLLQPYAGAVDCAVRTFRLEGFLPFWRGNLINVVRYFPSQALNFSFKEAISQHLHQVQHHRHALTSNVLAGGLAGSITLCIMYPLDFCRTRLANDTLVPGREQRQFRGFFDVMVKTVWAEGVSGVYRGFCISLLGIFMYRGIYFGLYDTTKPILLTGQWENNLLLSFLLAWGVTVTAGLMDYPVDTVRRRMMMTSGHSGAKYKGAWHCAAQIIKTEGFASLMKGAAVNILRGTAGAGVLAGYDKFKEIYLRHRSASSFT